MTESPSIASGAKAVSDAAALSLIDIRRIDRAAGKSAKRGDLTDKLKRQASGKASPPPVPAIIAPEAAPMVAPAAVSAAIVHRDVSQPDASVAPERAPAPVMAPAASPAEANVASAPPPVARDDVPLPEASVTPGPAAPPEARHAVPLPEPYVAPEPPLPPVVRRSVPLPEPYVAPEPPPAPEAQPPLYARAPEVSRAAPLPYDDLRTTDDLVYYWDELRRGHELPLFSNLDRTRIAISWPDTVMVNYDEDRAAVPQIARLSRLTGVVELTSMVTEWILSSSRQVARAGKAMETKRAFTGANSARSYHMLLLPFANSGGASDHVLCHLSSAD
jgi:hypothetical protein